MVACVMHTVWCGIVLAERVCPISVPEPIREVLLV